MKEPIKWPNQFAHMLFSTSILLGKALWAPHLSSWFIVGFLVGWAVAKELLWDVRVEKSQGYVGAAIDAAFYTVGTVGTSLALYFTGKF